MQSVIEELIKRKITISTAESCTGGLAAAAITGVAGASDIFPGGIVAYSNEVKQDLLGVQAATLEQHGAVSEETAKEMAAGVQKKFSTMISVSVSGIAGPGGGTAQKPVGTVCFAFYVKDTVSSYTCHFAGSREHVRTQSVAFIFETLKTLLQS